MVEVIYNHFLMLRLQKMLATVGFRTFGGGSRVLNPADKKRDKKFPQCVEGASSTTGAGCSGKFPKKMNFKSFSY